MADGNQSLSAFWRAYGRVVLACSAVQLLPEHARLVYLDPLTREIKAASHAYREAVAVTGDLQLPPLLLHATNLMQTAWSNRDYNDAAALVARSLPNLPADPEALQWAPRDAGVDRWWDALGIPPPTYYPTIPSSNTPASSSSFGSMPPTPTQTYAPPPPSTYVPSSSIQTQQQSSTPQLQMTVPIPEADFPPPRSSKRKDREESEVVENEEDDDARRRMRGKTLVITDEMRSAGVNDPPCERCRDTRRSCVRGPHSACLTCVAGKTACSLVPPKTSSGSKKDGSSEVPTKRRVRVNRPEFHVDMMQAPLSGPIGFMPPTHGLPMVPGNAPAPSGQWAPGYGSLDPNQTFVTRGELQAHEARMEARFRQIVQEEISAALSRYPPSGDASTSQSQSSLQPQ